MSHEGAPHAIDIRQIALKTLFVEEFDLDHTRTYIDEKSRACVRHIKGPTEKR